MKKAYTLRLLIKSAWKTVCQQVLLLAVLSMLFLSLPLAVGPVAENLLSRGVNFSGLEIALCAPEGENTAQQMGKLTASMQDVRAYASFQAMEQSAALEALERGAVDAVLMLPQDFIGGVLYGENPDVILVTASDAPLESLLTYWVGQSAADLLAGAQRGIYAVLELAPAEDTAAWNKVLTDINMEYISFTLNRSELFKLRSLSVVEDMDIGSYYGLSLLTFLVMALPGFFCPLFDGRQLPFSRRLRSVGVGASAQLGVRLGVCSAVTGLLCLVPVLLLTKLNVGVAVLLAVFGGAWAAFFCQAFPMPSRCGAAAFLGALSCLVACGGVVPLPLLPQSVQRLGRLLPPGLLRGCLADPLGSGFWGILGWITVLSLGSWLLMRRALDKEDG